MVTVKLSSPVKRLLASQGTLRTWSVVITIFGDSIVPRGGEVWLGTLTQIMKGLGIDDQAVRTAVSRLTRDGWLSRERVGRHSYYRLLEIGNREFAIATNRIYGQGPAAFDGRVTLLTAKAEAQNKGQGSTIGERLTKMGWGRMAPTVHFAFGDVECPDDIRGDVIRIVGGVDRGDASKLIALCWNLQDIVSAYREFIADFDAFRASMPPRLEPYDAVLTRTLLIHAYRRIVLRDPMLPTELLPTDWPGQQARQLAGSLYRDLSPKADCWFDENAVGSNGTLATNRHEVERRFV